MSTGLGMDGNIVSYIFLLILCLFILSSYLENHRNYVFKKLIIFFSYAMHPFKSRPYSKWYIVIVNTLQKNNSV